MKPDLILITGAPGSGKTTLARKLNDALYGYVHIDIDDVLQSFWEKTKDPNLYDRDKIGKPKAWNIIETLITEDVRLIIDLQAEEGKIKKFHEKYNMVNIHCNAKGAAERFYKRELLPDGSEPDWLSEHMPEIRRLEVEAEIPKDIGQKIIHVKTTNGYEPTIESIIKELEV